MADYRSNAFESRFPLRGVGQDRAVVSSMPRYSGQAEVAISYASRDLLGPSCDDRPPRLRPQRRWAADRMARWGMPFNADDKCSGVTPVNFGPASVLR